jgi:hypothetical protein
MPTAKTRLGPPQQFGRLARTRLWVPWLPQSSRKNDQLMAQKTGAGPVDVRDTPVHE